MKFKIKMTLIDDYLELQEKYEKKYGERTIVLMEVGGFFEIYGIVYEEKENRTNRGRIYEIAELTNLNVSKKNDKFSPVSDKNPLMAGFPSHSFDKWKDILLRNGYTIIKIEQEHIPGFKEPQRKITEIISPSLNMDTNNYTNHMMSIYLENIRDHKTGKELMFVGLSTVDITTGESYVYETHSTADDSNLGLDEVFRFVHMFSPIEIMIHTENYANLTLNELASYLEIKNEIIHFNNYSNCEYGHYKSTKYHNEILKKVFPYTKMLQPVEFIDMERMPFCLQSYIYLIQFCYEHNENIIQKWIKPKIWEPVQYLILSHDAIDQLNVMPNRYNRNTFNRSGINSLWDVLDNTITPMGRRLLRMNLSHPLINKVELQNRYDIVELLINTNEYNNIRMNLNSITDMDRLHRRIQVCMLHPSQIIQLEVSHSATLKLLEYVTTKSTLNVLKLDDNIIEIFKKSIEDYKSKFEFDKLVGVQNNQITSNIFKVGLYRYIDELQNKIDYCDGFMKAFADKLASFINNANIDIKNNERDGHYLSLSNSKATLLKEELKKYETIPITVSGISHNVNVRDIEFKSTTSVSKITVDMISKLSNDKIAYQMRINKMCMDELNKIYLNYSELYFETWKSVSSWVAKLDFLAGVAKVSYNNKYCKPILDDENTNSYIKCIELRHPIIERLNSQIQYIPNDIILGTDDNIGILLYGLNAVGKSSLMKSIGLSIIMAQAGFYVPASSFVYQPYQQLFTRISNHDNLFKGQSTFAVEMSELRSIIKRTNKNSIVLGDELCSGTETTSGVAIVASTIITLHEKQSSFLFATHLHDLSKLEDITNIISVKHYHMETIYEPNTKKIVYNRKLKEGSGSAIYGLEVAKALDLDITFIDKANEIRRKILGRSNMIIDNSTSAYNANIVRTVCNICKKPTEEVHHINEQHLADIDGFIGIFHKNSLFNLVQLCEKCHNKIHYGKLRISGYQQTSEGIELKYTELNEEKQQEINNNNDELNDRVLEIYNKVKSKKKTVETMKSLYNIDISEYRINKIVKSIKSV
jgi:DNA mismatch repair protein MutS